MLGLAALFLAKADRRGVCSQGWSWRTQCCHQKSKLGDGENPPRFFIQALIAHKLLRFCLNITILKSVKEGLIGYQPMKNLLSICILPALVDLDYLNANTAFKRFIPCAIQTFLNHWKAGGFFTAYFPLTVYPGTVYRSTTSRIVKEAVSALEVFKTKQDSDVGIAQILGHKADLMLTHYSKDYEGLARVQTVVDKTAAF